MNRISITDLESNGKLKGAPSADTLEDVRGTALDLLKNEDIIVLNVKTATQDQLLKATVDCHLNPRPIKQRHVNKLVRKMKTGEYIVQSRMLPPAVLFFPTPKDIKAIKADQGLCTGFDIPEGVGSYPNGAHRGQSQLDFAFHMKWDYVAMCVTACNYQEYLDIRHAEGYVEPRLLRYRVEVDGYSLTNDEVSLCRRLYMHDQNRSEKQKWSEARLAEEIKKRGEYFDRAEVIATYQKYRQQFNVLEGRPAFGPTSPNLIRVVHARWKLLQYLKEYSEVRDFIDALERCAQRQDAGCQQARVIYDHLADYERRGGSAGSQKEREFITECTDIALKSFVANKRLESDDLRRWTIKVRPPIAVPSRA